MIYKCLTTNNLSNVVLENQEETIRSHPIAEMSPATTQPLASWYKTKVPDYYTTALATIGQKGEILIYRKHLKVRAVPRIARALAGAIDIRFHGREIFALLPAETVPHSGYLDARELINARKALP